MSESPPPPLPPKESLIKRYKLIWRLLLNANLALGGQPPTFPSLAFCVCDACL